MLHISAFDVKAILSPEDETREDIKLLWSTPLVGEGLFVWRYHSECIQIKSGGTFYESPVSALQGPLMVDNNPVASKWVTVSEKSCIQIGESCWKLEIRQIKGLTITKFVGRGGSAFVYEVQMPDLPFRCVMKIPREFRCNESVEGEYGMLKYLENHDVPGVVRALPFSQHQGIIGMSSGNRPAAVQGPLLLLEYGGKSLLDLVANPKRTKKFDVRRIAMELCTTLKAMHSLRIDHGDIKPANILLSPKGSVTLIDIGTIKSSTEAYMSPEAQDDEMYQSDDSELMDQTQDTEPELLFDRPFTPKTDSWQLSMIISMLIRVNKDPGILAQDTKKSGVFGHREYNGRRRANFAVLRQATGELAVDFVKRLQKMDPRRRLTMQAALQHPYLTPREKRYPLRSRTAGQ